VVTPCVGAVVVAAGQLLLIQRGHPPEAGSWSLPGGRIEAGETDADALVREVREETGLEVTVGALVGTVCRPAPDGGTYLIRDYMCAQRGGTLRAGDDASAARWVPLNEVAAQPLVSGLAQTLRDWGVLGGTRARTNTDDSAG
jgi:ADP-ribose pyrophosphatase YjhB (NUDIX family)